MMNWFREWPTDPDYYWFYGKFWEGGLKELHLVKVFKTRNGFAYVSEGRFMYETEATGVWMRAQLPDSPVGEVE